MLINILTIIGLFGFIFSMKGLYDYTLQCFISKHIISFLIALVFLVGMLTVILRMIEVIM